MLKDIDTIDPQSGRILKENNTVINIADIIATATDGTGGIYVANELQHATHKGNAYGFDVDGTVGATSSLYFLGITGAKQIHFDHIHGDFQKGGIRIWLYEAPTTTANGTPESPINLNFSSSNISQLSLYSAPTITSNGTKKATHYFPLTGSGANISPASDVVAGGRVLKPNTKYLFRIENLDNATCTFGVNFIWHDDDNIL